MAAYSNILSIIKQPNVLFLFVTILLYASKHSNAKSLQQDNNPYRHVEVLDPEGKYRLEWLVDWQRERVTFNVTVETKGYVGFGISRRPQMDGADIVIGGVNRNKRAYFSDRHGVGEQVPVVDKKQDWVLHSSWESSTHTFLSFSRAFDTCDTEDIPINDDVLHLLWAYGETDNTNQYHYGMRGSVPMYLRDPDLTPRAIQENKNNPEAVAGTDVKIWSIKQNFRIPSKRTTFWCNIHKLSLSGKHHIIGHTFKINNESQPHMHHAVLFRCLSSNSSLIFEQLVDYPGNECYNLAVPLGRIPTQSCIEVKAGIAIGTRSVFFPEEMGIPIGATGQTEYYLWQVHYDNPTGRADLIAESELNIYYSSDLRPQDGGIINIGQGIPGAPSILLPPRSVDHNIFGICSSTCTKELLPPEGIKFVAAIFHSHSAGRRMSLRHLRNNKELPHILNDDNYMPTFQPTRLLRNERTILPGDQVVLRCAYDTNHTNRTTIGGYGADQEMCLTFIVYYNFLTDYPVCNSELISPAYRQKYLAGTTNVTWDQSRLEYEATAPPQLEGMTLTEISDSGLVNWNTQLRAELQRDHLIQPQVEICPSISGGLRLPNPPILVTNPLLEAATYIPPQPCVP